MLIGENYKIESDDLNVTLYERNVSQRGDNIGKEYWVVSGYFSSVKNALKYMIQHEILNTHLTDLKVLNEK